MDIRIFLYIVIIGVGVASILSGKEGNSARKSYMWLIITLLILESGLRSVFVGPDTFSYHEEFMMVRLESWREIFRNFYYIYVQGEGKDAGFHVIIKAFQFFSTDFNVFLLFIGALFYVPLGLILFKNTNNIWQLMFAFTLYVALFQIIALSGIRQQIATSGCFIAYLLLMRDKYTWATIVILLSGLVHISSLFFLTIVVLYIINLKFGLYIGKTLHFISFGLIPVILAMAGSFLGFLASFSKNDYYAGYSDNSFAGGAETYFYLTELLSFICLICISKKAIMNDKSLQLMYLTLPLTTFLAPLIMFDGTMIRLGQYFTLFLLLLYPKAIETKFFQSREPIYLISLFMLLVLSLKNRFIYTFFWQL